jgi:hypothetical protein
MAEAEDRRPKGALAGETAAARELGVIEEDE